MCCSHCLEDAGPDGQHMSREVFDRTVDFIVRNQFQLVFLSGGEPTDHPEFVLFVEHALNTGLPVLIASNGMWLKERPNLSELKVNWQITNDPRYYPKEVQEVKHPNIFFTKEIPGHLTPLGRYKDKPSRLSPLCFNLRSIVRQTHSFKMAVQYLRMLGKFCTPSVTVEGNVVAGESRFCHVIGTIDDSDETLTQNVIEMRCSNCGLINNLSPEYKSVIGEI